MERSTAGRFPKSWRGDLQVHEDRGSQLHTRLDQSALSGLPELRGCGQTSGRWPPQWITA